jgi:DNA-binding MarR family transcriptional regulator
VDALTCKLGAGRGFSTGTLFAAVPATEETANVGPGYLVWRTSMKWRAATDRVLAPLGLTHAQYSLLASLYALSRTGAQPSQRQLADFSGLEPVYVSRLARALERAGLVQRPDNPADPRAVQLALTERGAGMAVEAIAAVRELQEELTAPLGGMQSSRTRELVESLRALLDEPGPQVSERQ